MVRLTPGAHVRHAPGDVFRAACPTASCQAPGSIFLCTTTVPGSLAPSSHRSESNFLSCVLHAAVFARAAPVPPPAQGRAPRGAERTLMGLKFILQGPGHGFSGEHTECDGASWREARVLWPVKIVFLMNEQVILAEKEADTCIISLSPNSK
jgi:hypothetical protein